MKTLLLGSSSSIAIEYYNLYSNKECIDRTSSKKTEELIFLDAGDDKTYFNIGHDYDKIICFIGYTPLIKDQYSFEELKNIVNLNFIYPINLIEHILRFNLKKDLHFQVITSVASVRGRKLNYQYGASKAALSTALSGLRQKYPKINLQEIVLGPVRTKTVPIHETPNILVSNTSIIAKSIHSGSIKKAKRYIPYFWKYISIIITLIPEFIYKKLKF